MFHVITKPCVGVKDTACVTVCPVDCIHPTPDAVDFSRVDMLHIDPDTCIGCGLCVDECPVRAIFDADDVPAEWREFVGRNAAYYQRQPT